MIQGHTLPVNLLAEPTPTPSPAMAPAQSPGPSAEVRDLPAREDNPVGFVALRDLIHSTGRMAARVLAESGPHPRPGTELAELHGTEPAEVSDLDEIGPVERDWWANLSAELEAREEEIDRIRLDEVYAEILGDGRDYDRETDEALCRDRHESGWMP